MNNGTYTALSTEGVAAATGTWNDTVITLAAGTLPFSFIFNETAYTGLTINPNGYLMLGGTTTMGYTPITSSTTGRNVVSAFGCNLQGNTNSEIRYATLGSAPYRVFVVQWKHARKYNATGDSFNFQIRLEETTNKTSFVYGLMTCNATATTVQVGLRGLTNVDYKNLTSTTSWSSPLPGTSSSQTMTFSATVFPTTGQTYSWTPAVVIAVNLDTATQIRGCAIRLAYNTSCLNYSSTGWGQKGSIFTGQSIGWWRAFDGSPEEEPGVLRIECMIFGAGLSVTGPGNLLNITFNPTTEGYSDLNLLQVQLYDIAGNVIPDVSASAGSLIVSSDAGYAKGRLLLQGAYSNAGMSSGINPHLPLTSPYASDPSSVSSIPADVVDWLLVELRTSRSGAAIQTQAMFLHTDGSVTSPGKPYMLFLHAVSQPYYLVFKHRNHLAIMSDLTLNLAKQGSPPLFDFTNATNVFGTSGHALVNMELCAMTAGDANADGLVNSSDKDGNWSTEAGQSGYKTADVDLDGYVLPNDLNEYWRSNIGMASDVPNPGFMVRK